MSKLTEKFEGFLDKIKDAAVDFTTLEVTTITGSINFLVDSEGNFNAKDMVANMNTEGQNVANLDVLAHTNVDFDHDTINFIRQLSSLLKYILIIR